jgi:hypothetical protein
MENKEQNYQQGTAKLAYDTLLPAVVLDSEGYPTDEFLKWIEEFNPLEHQVLNFINVLFENWCHGDYGYKLKKKYAGYCSLELHTLGWSGNEDLLRALEKNIYFFLLYWKKTERGGHYYFSLPVADL